MLEESRWRHLLKKISRTPADNENNHFSAIRKAYNASYRHYHNAGHIEHCLKEFDAAHQLAVQPEEVEFAIWLHDVVYKPQAKDNEKRSAQWAQRILMSLGCENSMVERVNKLIMATQHHEPAEDADTQLLLDIDLSILGQPPMVYEVYEKNVRKEYKWVPKIAYRIGRRKVLAGFLEKPKIYQTQRFAAQYEADARLNIALAISQL